MTRKTPIQTLNDNGRKYFPDTWPWPLWGVIWVFLLVAIVFFLDQLGEQGIFGDLVLNLSSEFSGMIFTVLFVEYFINKRERMSDQQAKEKASPPAGGSQPELLNRLAKIEALLEAAKAAPPEAPPANQPPASARPRQHHGGPIRCRWVKRRLMVRSDPALSPPKPHLLCGKGVNRYANKIFL